MRNYRTLTRLLGRTFAVRLVTAAIGLLSTVSLLRNAGAMVFGLASVLITLSMLVSTVGFAWLGQAILRYGPYHGPVQAVASTRTSVVMATVAVLVGIASAFVVGADVKVPVVLLATTTLSLGSSLGIQAILVGFLQSVGRVVLASMVEAIRSAGAVFVLAVASFAGADSPRDACIVLCGLGVIGAVVSAAVVSKMPTGRDQMDDRPTPKTYVSYGLPIGLWLVLGLLFQQADRVVLFSRVDPSVAGEYTALYEFLTRPSLLLLRTFGFVFSSVVFAQGRRTGAASAIRSNLRATALTAVVGFIVATACVVAIQIIPVQWVGLRTRPALIDTVLIGFSAPIWSIALSQQRVLQIQERIWPMLTALAGTLVPSLSFLWIAAPRLGIRAASGATFVSAMAYATLVTVLAARSGNGDLEPRATARESINRA